MRGILSVCLSVGEQDNLKRFGRIWLVCCTTTRNSSIADKPRDAFRDHQGHQTWYRSIC